MTSTLSATHPLLIQGGMGIGVSNWRLARAVSTLGQLGVVSGTAVDTLFVRRLQDGDPGGHLRRAMEAFPWPHVATRALRDFFRPDGRPEGMPYRLLSMWRSQVTHGRERLSVLASFTEVFLAKEGHDGPVGINLLAKVSLPNLSTLYGAMLAGVDYVLMGAGIPREIPGALDCLAEHRPASLRLEVQGPSAPNGDLLTFTPDDHWDSAPSETLRRPHFFPIVASNSLARMMARKATGSVEGLVIEGPTAGGHNAPPRGPLEVNERGEPIYGERDRVDLEELAELGLPFWLAGGVGSPEGLASALEAGAAGIQVGTLFAWSEESGFDPDLKTQVLEGVRRGDLSLRTDLRASPTGFPFKVIEAVDGEVGAPPPEPRTRICDLGYLRTAYRRDDGTLGYRCPAEPVNQWVRKGGRPEETEGRRCLCNALLADVGHGQLRKGVQEPPLLTSGNDLLELDRFLRGRTHYSAAEVVEHLLSGSERGGLVESVQPPTGLTAG